MRLAVQIQPNAKKTEVIGVLDDALYQQTVEISTEFAVLAAAPDEGAARTDLAHAALEGLSDLDTTGESFAKIDVEVTPGGE